MQKIVSPILIGLLLIVLTGLLIERLSLYQDGYDIGYGDGLLVLPSVADIQRRIGCEKIDGWLCKSFNVKDHSETQTKWDAAYCQQSANVQINPKSMRIEK